VTIPLSLFFIFWTNSTHQVTKTPTIACMRIPGVECSFLVGKAICSSDVAEIF
jgi:hypothetical protein